MFEALFGGDGSMTKAEFNRAFQSIIQQIIRFEKKLLDKNTTASDELKRLFLAFQHRLEKKTDAEYAAFTKEVDAVVGDAIERFGTRLDRATADLSQFKTRLYAFKQPKDGKDGKDGSPDTGEEVIGKINRDKSDKKIKKEKVEGLAQLEAWIKHNNDGLSRLWLRSGGLVGEIVAGTNITVDSTDPGRPIVSATGGFSVKAATGTIDDSNVTFTFASQPTLVVVNGAVYQHGSGVTIATTTATLDNPVGTGGSIFAI